MKFEPLDFSTFNEADVRGEFLDFLLRDLGYKAGSENSIVREQYITLKYPKSALGRRKKDDPKLAGKPDYICIVEEKYRWVLEAKSPQEEITSEIIEQAYTYAIHPEINALYFCISNGIEFRVYQPVNFQSSPVFSTTYSDLNNSYQTLKNILLPDAIKRDWGNWQPDYGKPIGKGLRSICRIINGYFEFRSNNAGQYLNNKRIHILGGLIERDDSGKLQGYIYPSQFDSSMQLFAESYGMNRWDYVSQETELSIDPRAPTIFLFHYKVIVPSGETFPILETGMPIKLTDNLIVTGLTTAKGYLCSNEILGEFDDSMSMKYSDINLEMNSQGYFKLVIA